MGWGADNWIALASCAQVGVLGAAALYARGAVSEARRLRSVQTRPYVVVYVDTSRVARSLVDLVVENIGQTPARDVSVAFDPRLESSMRNAPGDDRVNDWVALSEGIPYLAPGQRMTHLLDSLISRYAADSKFPRRYRVTVEYSEVASRGTTERHSENYDIDIGVWYGSHYTTEYGIHDVGKALMEMGKTMSHWTREPRWPARVQRGLGEVGREKKAAQEEIIARQREATQPEQRTEGGRENLDRGDASAE
jgi:hypothetical protein